MQRLSQPVSRLTRSLVSRTALRHAHTIPTLEVVDCHAAGEPARIVVGGVPPVPGSTMMEKRDHMMEHMDGLRKLLLLEPRGYPCQNANFILPPTLPEAAFGYVIAEQNRAPAAARPLVVRSSSHDSRWHHPSPQASTRQ